MKVRPALRLFFVAIVATAVLAFCAAPMVRGLLGSGMVGWLPAQVKRPGVQIISPFSEGLASIREAGHLRLGFIDTNGAVVIQPRYFAGGKFAQGLAPVQVEAGSAWGFIDRTGTFVITPRFDAALSFTEDLAPVRLGGTWGFTDRTGNLVIAARYDEVWGFSEGRARAAVAGRLGFIDPAGNWVVPPTFFKAGDFHAGLAFVCERAQCGFLDRAGRFVIEPHYDDARSFGSGLAPVRVGAQWGYVERTGRLAIAPVFDEAEAFSEGLARVAVTKDASFDLKFGGYTGRAPFYGFIDPAGALVLATKMLGATAFSEGFTVVRLPSGGLCSDCNDYRLMSRAGEFLPGRFDLLSPMVGGVAIATLGQRSYVIDRTGAALVEVDRSFPQDPEDAARQVVNRRFGYIDATGATVLAFTYYHAQPFAEGLAFVEGPWQGKSRRRGFIDRSGALVVPVADSVSQALPFAEGLSLVSRSVGGTSRYGFMDRSGAEVISARFADAASFAEGLAAVKQTRDLSTDDWGYIDATGNTVIAPRFKAAGSFSHGLAYVERVTEQRYLLGSVIDRDGREVVAKPFLPEGSRMLFGTPSLEQYRQRRELVFGEGLVPTLDGSFRGWTGANGRRVAPQVEVAHFGLFADGRAPIATLCRMGCQGTWGYVDPDGKVAIKPRFAQAQRFSEGLAGVRDAVGRYGYITPSGDYAITPMWLEEAHPFVGGLALVKLNGRWGYLDRQGEFAIPPRYLLAGPFSEGLAAVAEAAKVDGERLPWNCEVRNRHVTAAE